MEGFLRGSNNLKRKIRNFGGNKVIFSKGISKIKTSACQNLQANHMYCCIQLKHREHDCCKSKRLPVFHMGSYTISRPFTTVGLGSETTAAKLLQTTELQNAGSTPHAYCSQGWEGGEKPLEQDSKGSHPPTSVSNNVTRCKIKMCNCRLKHCQDMTVKHCQGMTVMQLQTNACWPKQTFHF